MKFDLKPMDLVRNFTALCVALGLVYAAGLKTGWIIGEAEGEEIAQQKANVVYKELLVVQQKIYEELKQDDEDRLQADIQILMLQIEGMSSKPDRSEYEDVQLRIWNKQLEIKQGELADLMKAKAATP